MFKISIAVLQIYIQEAMLLKELYDYGFSEERSELSMITIKLLTFIIHCQEKSSIEVYIIIIEITYVNKISKQNSLIL